MTVVPKFEKLEDRILLTAEPTATLDGPDSVEIGQQDVGFTVTFDNTSGDDTPLDDTDGDVGFLPYVDVVLPQGEDGDDGITFDGATFLGTDLVPEILVFDENGEATHPLAVDAMGDPLIINGIEGDTLLVFTLPYGSFSPAQAPVDIELNLDFDPNMDLAPPPQISVNGGFALGQTAQDDPDNGDPTIIGATDTFTVAPQVFTVEKFNDAPESETATGPNYPRVWTIEVDIATGQTLDDIVIEDMLPNNVVYLGGFTSSVAQDLLTEPALSVAANGSSLTAGYDGPIVGVDGVDITITFDYFVSNLDADGLDVIAPDTGDDAVSINEVEVAADWVPADPRDDEVRLTETAQDTLTDKSIAIQKNGVLFDDQNVAGFSPGDTIEYTLDIQVSDFFTFGDLVITDTLGDGLQLDAGFTPTFTVTEEGTQTVNGEDISVVAVDNPTTGEQVLTFNLSDALLAETGDGILTGDLANDASQDGATTVQVVYRAVILSDFTTPTGDAPVSQGDILANNVQLDSNVLNNANNAIVEDAQSDTSAFEFQLPFGFIESKTVAAINGVAPGGNLLISAGDEVTFSILYNAPQGAYESLVISDFLPLPVFDATEMTTFDDGLTGTNPPAGTATFGILPSGFVANGGQAPGVISVNATSNSFELELGSLTTPTREEAQVEILFTVTVVDAIFADGLLLTNQSTVSEANTEGGAVATTQIAQFTYAEPVLNLTKGVVAFDSDNASLTAPTGPAGVTFADISSGGAPFTGVINSDGLNGVAGGPSGIKIDSDISGIDAGDTVRFAVTVENTGSSPGGAFDIRVRDTLPDGFSIPTSGLNLQVFDGAGAAISFSELTGGLFGDGIDLTDGMTRGAIGAADDASGANVAVIFYDLVADQTVEPSDAMPNTATLFNYAAFEGAIDRADEVADADTLVDIATAITLDPAVEKALLTTEFADGDSSGNQVLIGETITYRITIEVPEGTIDDLTLEDRTRQFGNDPVDGALEILSGEIVAFGANLSSENGLVLGSAATLVDNQLGDGINDGFTFDFGDLVNTADNDGHIGGTNDAADQIVIEVTARANAAAPTQIGDILTNQARMQYQVTDNDGNTRAETLVDNENVRVLEPSVDIQKTAGPEFVEGDNTAMFTLTVTAADGQFNSAAYDLQIIDLVGDPDLTLDPGSVMLAGAAANATITTGNGGGDSSILVDVTRLDPGEVLTITYTASVSPTPPIGDQLDNTADLTYDGTPIDDNPFERDYTDSDDAFVTVRAPDLTKTIIDTSFDETPEAPNVELNIGETVTFELVATIPEGVAPITITDTLPTTPGVLSFVDAEITAIGGNLSGSLLSIGDPGIISGGDVVFDFGTITNTPDGMQNALDEIRIEITAIVSQDPSTASGDELVNSATLDFGLGEVSDTAEATVTEPVLTIDKSGAPLTGDAGDVVDYALTAEHEAGSTGPAYDLVIADPLIATFLALNDGTVTATIGGVAIPAAQIIAGNGAGDAAIRIEVPLLEEGQVLEITYSGTLTQEVTYAQSLTNTATADYDSNPSDNLADGRQADQISDDETFVTDSPTLAKEVFDTEYADTTGNQVNIGEAITYRLTIDLPEGTSDITLADFLPDGVDYISSSVISITAGASTTGLGVGDDGVNAGQTTTFDFGEVVSTATAGAGDDQIVVEIVARVNPDGGNVDGVMLQNNATLTFENGVAAADATVEVVEPLLTLTKSGAPITGDAGDLIDYSIRVEHDGASSGPAFDIMVLDDVAAGLLDLSAGGVTAQINGVDIPAAQITLGNTAGDTTVRIDVPQLDQGEVLLITYTAVLNQDVSYNQTITNTALTDYDSADSDAPTIGRAGDQLSDDESVVTPEPVFAKEIFRSNQDETAGDDLTIGEEVTYRLTITLPEGASDIVVEDVLQDGLVYVSSAVFSFDTGVTSTGLGVGDSGVNAGQTTTFDLGEVISAASTGPGDDVIILEITARVDAVTSNVDGVTLRNDATMTFENGMLSASETVDIIEPLLTLDKAVTPTTGDAGDRITYTLTIEHDPASNAPGYDIKVQDFLSDAALSLEPGSVVAQIDATDIPAAQITEGNAGDDTTVVVDVPVLEQGEVLTVTFTVLLDQSTTFLASIDNRATADYDSAASDDPAIGRPGDQVSDEERVTTPGPALTKEVFSTSVDETTGADVGIGELITYRLTIDVPQGTSDLVLDDVLPAGLVYVSSVVFDIDDNITTTGLGEGVEGVNVGQTTMFDFGEIISAATLATGDDQIIVDIVARVDDAMSNVAGVMLTNSATLTFDNGAVEADAMVEIVEPLLVMEKAVTPTAADGGDTLNYTITVQHDPNSSAAAFDVVVVDDTFLTEVALDFNGGTVVVEIDGMAAGEAIITIGDDPADTSLSVLVPVLEVGETLTVTFTATVADAAPFDSTIINEASIDYDSNPSDDPNDGRAGAQLTDDAEFATPPPTIDKTLLDPGDSNVVIGETVEYRIRIELPDGTSPLTLTDIMPTLASSDGVISFQSGQVISVGSGISNSSLAAGGAPTSDDLIGADGFDDTVVFDFGAVTVVENMDADYNVIVVEVVGLVEDIADNARGDGFTNTATLDYGAGQVSDTQDVSLGEPKLVLDKEGDLLAVEPGDTVTYTITVDHTFNSDAEAQDIVISDLLADASLSLVDGTVTAMIVGANGSPAPVILQGNGGEGVLEVSLATLNLGDQLVITYDGILDAGAQPAQSFINTATVDFDSLSGPGGRPDSAVDQYRIATVPALFKSVADTSFAETEAEQGDPLLADVGIGEQVTYTYQIFLPEVLSEDLVFVDQLPILNDGTFTFESIVIDSVGSDLTLVDTTLDGMGGLNDGIGNSVISEVNGLITINFGDVDNVIDNDVDNNERIVIRVTGFIDAADAENIAGVELTNAAQINLSVTNPDMSVTDFEVTDQQIIEIVEPDLNIEKSVTPAEADAGDILTYTIQVSHDPASTGPAYDVVITDPLLANLSLNNASVLTNIGTVTTGSGIGDNSVRIDIPVLDIGQSATITFQATLGDGALFNSTETNTATLAYDSDPDDMAADERIYAPETDDASVTTPSPTVSKTVFDSSVDETDGSSLVVGETVTYRVTIDMPEGSSPMTLVDTLPDMGATLSYQSAQIVSQSANVSFSAMPMVTNVGAVTTFDFSTVTVAGVDGGPGGQIVVEIVALVEDLTPDVVGGASFTNMVDLNFNGGLVESEATVNIVEPEFEIAKSGPAAANPGDVLDYSLTVDHTGDSTSAAFDIVVADTLSNPNLILDAGSITAAVGGVAVDPSAIVVTNGGGQDGFAVSIDTLLLGQTLIINYQAQLDPNAAAANTFTNTATLAYDSIGTDDEVAGAPGRSAADGDNHNLATIPTISKTIIDTSYDETTGINLGIGETVTFRLDISIAEADYDSLVITDQLPTGGAGILSFVSATLDTTLTGVPLTIGAPTITAIDTDGDTFQDRITYDFGAVVNPFDGSLGADDRIVVELVARVEDLPQTAAGAGLTNNAAVDGRIDGVALDTQRDTAPTTVVEPDLAIAKAANVTDADAGDEIEFTLTVTHTANSSGPAYDVILQDMLADTGLDLIPNTATLTIDMVDQSGLITSGNGPMDTLIRADIPVFDFMQSAVLRFTAVVSDAAEFNGSVDNASTLDYDSSPSDDPADGRIYDQETDDVSIATPSPTFEKSLLTTSTPETIDGEGAAGIEDIGIGEVITYRFTAVLPEGTAPLVITDQLPLDGVFEFVGVTTTPGVGVSGAGLANPGAMFVDSNADGNADRLTINLGAVTNTGQNNAAGGAGDLFVDVQIRVLDDPANERGDVFTNTAELDFGAGTLTDDETVEIVEPALSIAKAINVTEADAGDIITYTLTVTHDAESNMPAYDVIIQDLLADTGLALEPGGATLLVGGVAQPALITEGNAGDDVIARADIPVLELGQTAIFTFTAVVTDAAEFNGSVENEASLNYDSDPEDDPTIGRNYDQETDDQSFTTPSPSFQKSVLTTSNDDTVGLNVAIGEIVTYRFAAVLPEGTSPISLTDQLPLTAEFELIGVLATPGTGVSGDALAAPAFSFVDTNGDGVADLLTIDAGVVTNAGQDNDAGGAGDLFIDAQFRVLATPDVVDGAIFTNTAELDFDTGTITDDASIRIVEPDISIEKSVSPLEPFLGDIVTYSIVISNDADATAPAYNLVVTDPIPEDMVFQTGSVIVSDNALATPDNTASTLIVSIPRLAPGETVTIKFEAQVAFDATPLSIITNTVGVEGGSDPDAEGRPIDLEDDADLAIQFVSGGKDVGQSYGGIDDETFLPVLTIDPIFSGTAEPGAQVMLTMIGRNGQPLGVQTMLTGAGGHWVIRFPQIDLPSLDHDFDSFYATSRLFDDPTGLFEDLDRPLIPSPEAGRFAPVGAQPEDANYSLRMQITPGPRGLEAYSTFNARSYFVPANIGLPVVGEDRMTVAEVFEELPDVTLENLMTQARDPLANGLNRFNYEFLAASSAVSG